MNFLNSWGLDMVLGVEVYYQEICSELSLINVYGLCQDKVSFWSNLLSKSLMNRPNLVVGGDLYFSLGLSESYGPTAQADRLTNYFMNKFKSENLIDTNLVKYRPTW